MMSSGMVLELLNIYRQILRHAQTNTYDTTTHAY